MLRLVTGFFAEVFDCDRCNERTAFRIFFHANALLIGFEVFLAWWNIFVHVHSSPRLASRPSSMAKSLTGGRCAHCALSNAITRPISGVREYRLAVRPSGHNRARHFLHPVDHGNRSSIDYLVCKHASRRHPDAVSERRQPHLLEYPELPRRISTLSQAVQHGFRCSCFGVRPAHPVSLQTGRNGWNCSRRGRPTSGRNRGRKSSGCLIAMLFALLGNVVRWLDSTGEILMSELPVLSTG